jgi:hypothetical protein
MKKERGEREKDEIFQSAKIGIRKRTRPAWTSFKTVEEGRVEIM